MSSSKRIVSKYSPKSIRFRITAFFVSFLGITLIIFSSILYRGVVQGYEDEFDGYLFNYTTDVARSLDSTLFGEIVPDPRSVWDRVKRFPFRVGETHLQIVNRAGRVFFPRSASSARIMPFSVQELKEVSRFQARGKTVSWNGKRHRVIYYPIEVSGTNDLILMMAVSTSILEQARSNLFTFFLFAVPFTLLIVAFGGFYLSGKVLAPISLIIDRAGHISASQLSERLPVPETDDELHDLSMTLNNLLDRLEKAFLSQERFVSDASHQLKTPIAILQGELDVLQNRERTPEEIEEFLNSVREETKHLQGMIDNLLALAKVDADRMNLRFEKVRLDEIIVDVISRLNFLATEKGLKIRFDIHPAKQDIDSSFELNGDSELLKTMVQNLVENAIKFSEEKGVIEIHLESLFHAKRITVRNYGPAISREDQEKIFTRFYRGSGESSQTPGLGIGLALVKRIAEVHNGAVSVESTEKLGTSFSIDIKNF